MGETPSSMKTALIWGARDLRIEEVQVPEPGPGEVLVRVKVALTCGTDLKTLKRGMHRMIPSLPSPFGHEFSGVVEKTGEGVQDFRPGQAVVAANSAPCGRCDYCKAGRANLCDELEFLNGAYAEFIRIPASIVRCNLHLLPDSLDPVQAALTEPLACVLHGIERSGIEMGQSVCVIGMGPIGLMFVTLAAQKGASVIAVGRNRSKLEKALKLGAAHQVEMGDLESLQSRIRRLTPGEKGPDVVIEAVGMPQVWEVALNLVKKGGLVNLFGGCARGTVARVDAHLLHYEEKSVISVFHHTPHFVATALRLLALGVVRAQDLVTHQFPLEDLPRAFELMEHGQAIKAAIWPGRGRIQGG
jgi:L-iditol 2-dehydrogenase